MIQPDQLASDAYRQEQMTLHQSPRRYGHRGGKWADVVRGLMHTHEASSLLDYGCGQGQLCEQLRADKPTSWRLAEYDIAIDGKSVLPSFADLVVCTDVLEHVEPDKLSAVLQHLHLLARKAVFVVVSLVETAKTLSDGRNAHLTIQPAAWWIEQFIAAKFHVEPHAGRGKTDKEWVGVLIPT